MLRKTALPAGIVEAARDRRGRMVYLSDEAMAHIEQSHPEMRGCELAITTAIENAMIRCVGRKQGRVVEGREKLFARALGPGEWLAVVVAYDGDVGHVITAHADKTVMAHAAQLDIEFFREQQQPVSSLPCRQGRKSTTPLRNSFASLGTGQSQ
jgi:hypothetical protein